MSDRPNVHPAAEEVYSTLDPAFTIEDEANDWALLHFLDAVLGTTLGSIFDWVTDRDGKPGWSILLDADSAPPAALPWLAQFIGVRFTQGMSVDDQRAAIKVHEGFDRGTVAALVSATKRTLTGTQRVIVRERFGGAAYQLQVRTLASETPNAAVTELAALSQKAAGLVLDYAALVGLQWSDVVSDFDTWADVRDEFATWDDLRTALP